MRAVPRRALKPHLTASTQLWIKDGTAPVSVLWDPTLPVFHARRRLYAASETFQNLSEPVWLSSIIAVRTLCLPRVRCELSAESLGGAAWHGAG